jgi:hypothetical protein
LFPSFEGGIVMLKLVMLLLMLPEFLFATGAVYASGPEPKPPFITQSSNGKYCVILNKRRPSMNDWPLDTPWRAMLVCSFAKLTTPLSDEAVWNFYTRHRATTQTATGFSGATFKPRGHDVIVGVAFLDFLPSSVVVSSSGHGVAFLNNWPPRSRSEGLVLIGREGHVTYRKTFAQLLGASGEAYPLLPGRGGREWLAFAYYNEGRGQLVLFPDHIKARHQLSFLALSVELSTGIVRRIGYGEIEDVIETVVADESYGDLQKILVASCNSSWKVENKTLRTLFKTSRVLDDTKVLCGVMLHREGDQLGREFVMRSALNERRNADLSPREYSRGSARAVALLHLSEVSGAGASEAFKTCIKKNGSRIDPAIQAGLLRWGEDSVPFLVEKLRNSDDVEGRVDALSCITGLGSKAKSALPTLIEVLSDTREFRDGKTRRRVSVEAAQAVGAMGSDALAALPVLTRLMESASAVDRFAAQQAVERIYASARPPQ